MTVMQYDVAATSFPSHPRFSEYRMIDTFTLGIVFHRHFLTSIVILIIGRNADIESLAVFRANLTKMSKIAPLSNTSRLVRYATPEFCGDWFSSGHFPIALVHAVLPDFIEN